VGLLPHWGDETVSTPTDSGDIPWRLGRVLQGAACGPNTAAQGVVRDELVRPQALEQLVAGDDAVAMQHEIGEDIEDLRSERDEFASATQFIPLGVETIVAKEVAHHHPSCLVEVATTRVILERHHT
jgi:hypothetical protein